MSSSLLIPFSLCGHHKLQILVQIEIGKVMAVVTKSFSIREYTEKMRSFDLRRCWPFDGRGEGGSQLPSIAVRRFKWWSDELESIRSIEKRDDRSESAADVAISEADANEAARISKVKQRTPKKRSIVELFAVSPLIEGAVDTEEEKDEFQESDAAPINNVLNRINRRKSGMKKNKGFEEGQKGEITCDWEKEKIWKPKQQNPVCRRKKSRKSGRVSAERQKQPSKGRSVGKKLKALQRSMLVCRNPEVPKQRPVRSILKHRGRRKASSIEFYCESNKRVTFSVKDDLVGSSRDLPQLQNLCKIFSNVLAASPALSCPDAVEKNQLSSDCNRSFSGKEKPSFDLNRAADDAEDDLGVVPPGPAPCAAAFDEADAPKIAFEESSFTPDSVSSKSKCPAEDFIGLPLNSQGELIQFHSGANIREAYTKQSMEFLGSSSRASHLDLTRKKVIGVAAAAYQKTQPDPTQKQQQQCYSTRERVRHWLNFAELEGSESSEIPKNEPAKNFNSNSRSHSLCNYRKHNLFHGRWQKCSHDCHHNSQPASPPRMRLMGKNVVVGGAGPAAAAAAEKLIPRQCASRPSIKGDLLQLLDSPPNLYHTFMGEAPSDIYSTGHLYPPQSMLPRKHGQRASPQFKRPALGKLPQWMMLPPYHVRKPSNCATSSSRPGPTKLMAGAKHILKPYQRREEESCTVAHSTIFFPATAGPSPKLFPPPHLKKKVANIYNF